MIVKNHRAPGINMLRVGAGAIDADDVSEILDGARFEESGPMALPFVRPGGDDDEHFGALSDGRSEDLWKAQVVTDERDDLHSIALERCDSCAAGVILCFAAEGERMDFCVAGDQVALR